MRVITTWTKSVHERMYGASGPYITDIIICAFKKQHIKNLCYWQFYVDL